MLRSRTTAAGLVTAQLLLLAGTVAARDKPVITYIANPGYINIFWEHYHRGADGYLVTLYPDFSPGRAPKRPDVWDQTAQIHFITRAQCDRVPGRSVTLTSIRLRYPLPVAERLAGFASRCCYL